MTSTAQTATTPNRDLWPKTGATATVTTEGSRGIAPYLWALTRLSLASVFLWAFLDKTFGLGHETTTTSAWINGGSPTAGFLKGSVGPFAGFYHSLAGMSVVDWLFMVGLLGIGITLLLGMAMRTGAIAGAILMVLMWSASLPPKNHIFMDDHIVYALVLLGLLAVGAANTLGLGNRWGQTALVQRFQWLK